MLRLLKNTAYFLGGRVVALVFSFILSIYMARKLGPSEVGIYYFSWYISGFFMVFGDLGLNTLFTKELSRFREQADSLLGLFLPLKVLLSSISLALFFVFVPLSVTNSDERLKVWLIGLSGLLQGLYGVTGAVFKSFERLDYEGLFLSIEKICFVSLSLMVLWFGLGLKAVGLVLLLVTITIILFRFRVVYSRFARFSLRIQWKFWKQTLLKSLPLGFAILLENINFKLDSILLKLMVSSQATGIYNVAYRLILLLGTFPVVLQSALFPIFARDFLISRDRFSLEVRMAFKFLLGISGVLFLVLFLKSDWLILFLYGERYRDSIWALRILAGALLFSFPYYVTSLALIVADQEWFFFGGWMVTAVTNVVLNLWLIPVYHHIGASLATLGSEAVLFFTWFYGLKRVLPDLRVWRDYLFPLLVFIAPVLWINHFFPLWLQLLLLGVQGILVFGTSLVFREDERKLAWDFLVKRGALVGYLRK